MRPPGRPTGECRSAQHDDAPVSVVLDDRIVVTVITARSGLVRLGIDRQRPGGPGAAL